MRFFKQPFITHVICKPNFLHILQVQSFGLQSFIFCLKIFKLYAFFNSTGKSFQRIAPILLTVSKPNLLGFMFPLCTVTPHLRLKEIFSLKLKISLVIGGKSPIFTLYISVSKYFIII